MCYFPRYEKSYECRMYDNPYWLGYSRKIKNQLNLFTIPKVSDYNKQYYY